MKRFALFTNVISPHQLPLANGIAKLVGDDNFRYIYTQEDDKDHRDLDWQNEAPRWCINVNEVQVQEWLESADVLLSGLREFDLFERRATKGLKNLYMTERWFKPPIGIFRLLHPRYSGYARRLCRMMTEGSLVGSPIGIHAAKDIARLCGLMHGDFRCLFRAPKLDFERKPGGRIYLAPSPLHLPATATAKSPLPLQLAPTPKSPLQLPTTTTTNYCLDKMRMWGYFVEGSKFKVESQKLKDRLRVLWVGRLLKLKHVDTIIRAVGELSRAHAPSQRLTTNDYKLTTNNYSLTTTLDIYGTGPEEIRLKKLAAKYGDAIKFHPPVPIDEVRKLMREHDVYVLASNGYEGWGAVVSEALEEGMRVIGTYEAGSSVTMLPKSCLFHSGDWRTLKEILQSEIPQCGIGTWSAKDAATELVKLFV